MPTETTLSPSATATEILSLLGHDEGGGNGAAAAASLEALRKCTHAQLVDYARRLGLTGVTKLTKEVLAGRLQLALDKAPLGGGGQGQPEELEPPASGNGGAPFPGKFDLGPDSHEGPTPQNIPWSYGQNRVTAMVVDPEKMFVYWECTDSAIDSARRGLGEGGRHAWLCLRVYDITGRLFDGTNAHGYFDHNVERSDRQWFFQIGKPTSVACVELGLKSTEGFFIKISRSGRAEFPRREPAGSNHVEWLTVTAGGSTIDAGQTHVAPSGPPGGAGAFGAATAGQRGLHGVPDTASGDLGGPLAPVGPHAFERRWEWRELVGGGVKQTWQGERTQVEWIGPLIRSAWEAGPFTYAVQSPAYVEEWNDGTMSVRSEHGKVHIVYGPWQVVIRGIGARAERRVLATWEIRRSWETTLGTERSGDPTAWRELYPGSSELVALGASERSWMGGSELRLGGASELFMMGASELRFGGASETLYTGASEWLMRGASERMYRGASEWLYRGASERMYAGASEQLYAGASERLYAGASERLYGGASEQLVRAPGEPHGAGSGAYPASLGTGDRSEPTADASSKESV